MKPKVGKALSSRRHDSSWGLKPYEKSAKIPETPWSLLIPKAPFLKLVREIL